MNILYDISIYLYVFGINIAALFNTKARLWIIGRRSIWEKLKSSIKEHKNIVWFHCSSLGEFEQGKIILQKYKEKYSNHKILLTFFSPSGYEVRKNTPLADFIFYLPADTKANAKKFIDIVNPIKVIFIKYEFWFNYMAELKKQNIPFYSASAIFYDNQTILKYKWFANQLRNVTHFFVQDENSDKLLKKIGFRNTTISGDSRFDSVISNLKYIKKIPLIEDFIKYKTTIIFGSTWPKDEKILVELVKKNPNYNYIIAPHEMQHIGALQKRTNALLYSNINIENVKLHNTLIIDSIGMLSSIYKYGDIAYIGGGFGAGIHNILEAAVFNLPIIFGPNYLKCKEAADLIKLKGGISITKYEELERAINYFLYKKTKIGADYVQRNSGATDIIINKI